MGIIRCSSCNKDVRRWTYEIKQIKDVQSYKCQQCRYKDSRIEKICPVCKSIFKGRKCEMNKKVTCSHACSNKHFRSGESNGNWKQDTYRSTCFLYHKKKCVVCTEEKIVEVHHYNGNHKDNNPKNLIPLCPTHHQYMHSKHRDVVEDAVNKYYNNFNG